MFEKYFVFAAFCPLVLPLRRVFAINGKYQTQLSYVGRNNRLRAMYIFTSPQATNSRLAFLSRPR